METTNNDQFNAAMEPDSERPQFLKILCILSFVASGLLILIFAIGTMSLAISGEMVEESWTKVVETQPALENIDPVEFFHELGMYCLYGLIATIFSLIGVIMMWRLEKMGLIIYAIAELATHFIQLDLDFEGAEQSSGGTIFFVIIDLIFIGMYAMNLKFMNKSKNPESQSLA